MTFQYIAHRGASADAVDNSLQAFELAIEQRADLIETDVQITQDGVLVLEHDADVAGRSVATLRLTELRALRPDLVTVAQCLAQFGPRIPVCWEIKAPGCETALVTMVRDLLPEEIWRRTEFTSFFFGTAVHLAELAPANHTGWLTREWSKDAIHKVRLAGLKQICPQAADVLTQPNLVRVAVDAGLLVRVWRVQTPAQVPGLIAAGVYGGTVNWPEAARHAATT